MEEFDYINKQQLADSLGVKLHTIDNWMANYWRKGIHYIVIGRITIIRRSKIIDWIESFFEPEPLAQVSRRRTEKSARATPKEISELFD